MLKKAPANLDKILASIAENADRSSLLILRENAVKAGSTPVIEACDARLAFLVASGVSARPSRLRSEVSKLGSGPKRVNQTYRGAFHAELIEHVERESSRSIQVWLPLANQKDGQPRGRVAAEVRLDEAGRLTIEDLDRRTNHLSLSDLRAEYGDRGGGSDSWTRFLVADGRSIADYLGVDPKDAQESRRQGWRVR